MKQLVLSVLLCAATSYAVAQTPYRIKGEWKDGAGKTVYLMKSVSADSVTAVDSVKVGADGTFQLQGKVSHVQAMILGSSPKDKEDIFVDGEPLTATIETITTKKKDGSTKVYDKVKVQGGREQNVLLEGKTLQTTFSFFQLGKMIAVSKAIESKSQAKQDSVKFEVAMIDSLSEVALNNYMDSTRNDLAVTCFFQNYLFKKCSLEDVEKYYNQLTDRVKKSYPGKEVSKALTEMRAVNVGGTAPDFTLSTPDGKKLSLSSLRGKVVLLDFWASWCGPCLAEMPNVKKIYETYHSKGLEILGVSLDEKQAAWVNMIEKKGLNWNHVSSLKGWKCPVAARYNVTGIPRMYIIDKKGKIIAQDLRGQELADKMQEIFSK